MTKQEWRRCTDAEKMFRFLRARRRQSERKLRLYLCGGCRYIAHLFFHPASLSAVGVAERFADGEATSEELERAEWLAESPTFGFDFEEWFLKTYPDPQKQVVLRLVVKGALAESVLDGGEWRVNEAVQQRLLAAAELAEFCAAYSLRKSDWGLGSISQVDWPDRWLFDCVFGNPFRPAPSIDPAWLSWNDRIIPRMAAAAYEQRSLPEGTFDPARLAVLVDALEEAGCSDQALLEHLRAPGPHARGCFPVDAVLGKK
jgi:hypothetical protein